MEWIIHLINLTDKIWIEVEVKKRQQIMCFMKEKEDHSCELSDPN